MRKPGTVTLVTIACLWTAAGTAAALASTERPKEESSRELSPAAQRRAKHVDSTTARYLAAATEALQTERFDEARALLAKLKPSRLNPYEHSRVEQMLAGVAQAQGEYEEAREHLLGALASGGLDDDEATKTRYQIAQLSVAQEKWADAVEHLEHWFRTAEGADAAAYYLLGVAYYQMQNYRAALAPARKAIELSEQPREQWLQLVLALEVQREDFGRAAGILKELIAIAPEKKAYWSQLSSAYAATGEYEHAAAVLQSAYRAGLLTETDEIRRFAQLLAHVGIPFRAAEILDREVDDKSELAADAAARELLGNCWVAAREYQKAVVPLEQAGELAKNGDTLVRLAQVLAQREDWNRASEALRRALEKGSLSNPAGANLLMGIVAYNRRRPTEARTWFERASRDEALGSQAQGWLRQIQLDLSANS